MSPSSHWSDPILYPWLSLRKKQKPKRKENLRLQFIHKRNARKHHSKRYLNYLHHEGKFGNFSLSYIQELAYVDDLLKLIRKQIRIIE